MAAQGDRPNVLIYFKEKYNMNINEVDENGSTPLHWACYMSSEISINYITPIKKYQKIKNKKLKEIKKIKNKKVKKMSSTSIKIQEDALKLRDYLDENNEQLINQFIDTHDENFFLKAKLDEDKKISLFHKIAFSDMTLIFYSVLQKFISKFGNKNSILPQLFSMEDIDGNTPLLFAAFRGNI